MVAMLRYIAGRGQVYMLEILREHTMTVLRYVFRDDRTIVEFF